MFSDIRRSPFTIKEAAEYFEVAEITVRRWGKGWYPEAQPDWKKNIVFDPDVLKAFKKQRQ